MGCIETRHTVLGSPEQLSNNLVRRRVLRLPEYREGAMPPGGEHYRFYISRWLERLKNTPEMAEFLPQNIELTQFANAWYISYTALQGMWLTDLQHVSSATATSVSRLLLTCLPFISASWDLSYFEIPDLLNGVNTSHSSFCPILVADNNHGKIVFLGLYPPAEVPKTPNRTKRRYMNNLLLAGQQLRDSRGAPFPQVQTAIHTVFDALK